MLRQSKLNLKSRILDCFDFLQKSRNDGVGGIVIAICCAFCAVIARALPEAIQKIKSFCFVLLSQNEESPYPLDSNLQSKISLIHYWLIYFSHCFKSRVFDTSLHCVPLSMTKFLPHHDKTKRVVILSLCKRRSIHFGDFRILRDSLTLRESMRQRFKRFSTPHTTFKGIKMQT